MICHVRKGKFGKKEQHMEAKLAEYLRDIERYACGGVIDIKRFTMKHKRILDSGRIKETAEKMVTYNGNITDKKEKEFFTALLYCNLALMSSEFTYIPDDDPMTDRHSFTFPKSFIYMPKMTLESLGNMYNTLAWEGLYTLLAGDHINMPDFYEEPDFSDDPELEDEITRDNMEYFESLDMDEIMEEEQRAWEEEEEWEYMPADEAEEYNRVEGNRIKAIYPGYMDFLSYTHRFIELAPDYLKPGFEDKAKKMTTEFALAEGYSIYSDEKKYLEVMVQINKARKLLMKHMGEINK